MYSADDAQSQNKHVAGRFTASQFLRFLQLTPTLVPQRPTPTAPGYSWAVCAAVKSQNQFLDHLLLPTVQSSTPLPDIASFHLPTSLVSTILIEAFQTRMCMFWATGVELHSNTVFRQLHWSGNLNCSILCKDGFYRRQLVLLKQTIETDVDYWNLKSSQPSCHDHRVSQLI